MLALSATVKNRLFIAAGSISLGIGIVGIVVPLLPTTPFLLLAAYCYGRGSRRLSNRLLSNKLVGSYLRNYLEGKAMSLKAKIWSISLLWIVIGCTTAFITDSQIIRIVLLSVGSGVTAHVALLRVAVVSKPDILSKPILRGE